MIVFLPFLCSFSVHFADSSLFLLEIYGVPCCQRLRAQVVLGTNCGTTPLSQFFFTSSSCWNCWWILLRWLFMLEPFCHSHCVYNICHFVITLILLLYTSYTAFSFFLQMSLGTLLAFCDSFRAISWCESSLSVSWLSVMTPVPLQSVPLFVLMLSPIPNHSDVDECSPLCNT